MAVTIQACIVIAGCVLVHLTLGTLYTFGNLNPYMTSYIRKHATPSDLNYATSVWINSLAAMFQGVSMYFGGVLERRLNNPRVTVLMGAWFQSLGILLTYFSVQHSFALTMLTYGVMFGLGIGIAYAVPMAVAMRWLPDRPGLVNGFVVAGFGGGAFIFDQVQTAYVNPHNIAADLTDNGEKYFSQDEILDRVPKLFLLLGGCYAGMQFLGCLALRNPPGYQPPKPAPRPLPVAEPDEERRPLLGDGDGEEDIQHGNRNILHDAHDGAADDADAAVVGGAGREVEAENPQRVNFVGALYKAYGQTFISNDTFLAWVGTFSAVCNASGRIFWGSVADRFSFPVSFMCFFASFTVLMLTLGVTSLGVSGCSWCGSVFSSSPSPAASPSCPQHARDCSVITSLLSAVLTSELKNAIGWYGMFFMVAGFSFF
ncbi:hypothetical protein BaRGS_00033500, partial [Batillaria attramentaria]